MPHTITNKALTLTVDELGRIVSLKKHATGVELITYPDIAETFRLVIPTGRHTLAFVYGSKQAPPRIDAAGQIVTIYYDSLEVEGQLEPIRMTLMLTLVGNTTEIQARARIDNGGNRPIDEVEFPVVGGLGGVANLTEFHPRKMQGMLHGDVLNRGLPNTGREYDQYVREHETAMWEDAGFGRLGLDLYGVNGGLFVGYLTPEPQDFVFKLERFPKFQTNERAHYYPASTRKWLRLWGVHLPRLAPRQAWESQPVTLYLHHGEWHEAAAFIAQRAYPDLDAVKPPRGTARLEAAPTPKWMDDFVGWTEITGKLYTGEVFHDFARCADRVLADNAVTGLDLLFYYGHTNLGAEGADFDQSPAEDLGGERGFAEMIRRLHDGGVRVMLLDHFHHYINHDIPEYEALGLERYALIGEDGKPVESRWWKETVLSCRRLAGPTPRWIEICPYCEPWQEYYRAHVLRMVERGVDGLELDCFWTAPCFSREHGHAPRYNPWKERLESLGHIRAEAQRRNPDFIFILETMDPESRAVCDGWYNNRAMTENNRIQRFMFPHLRQQAVRVGNYAYDAVNKALMFGIGVETEIWGLRTTALDGCPELAEYIGQVNGLRRQYGDILIRGTFRDTLGADVVADGTVYHSVLDGGPAGKALVLRNPGEMPVACLATLDDASSLRLSLVRPGRKTVSVSRQPVKVKLGAYQAAVLIAQ